MFCSIMMQAFVFALLSLHVLAYPFALEEVAAGPQQQQQQKRQIPSTTVARALSEGRSNCGNIPCLTFSEDQLVSTTGRHAYQSPAANQIRGPCPGLNAAANHGYIDRSGVTNIVETITGMEAAWGMGPVLSGFLAAYAVLMTGDILTQSWSIGGPPPDQGLDRITSGLGGLTSPLSGLLGGILRRDGLLNLFGKAQGISFAHNIYESDMSIGRADAFLNNGDAHSLDLKRFADVYRWGVDDGTDRYTLDKFAQDFQNKGQQSIAENPMFFSGPFSGILVAPAAYMFVINLMSNHSAEEPSGWLDGAMFKTFFAVEGDYPNFRWLPGQERIPDNWYKRPTLQPYDAANVNSDLAVQYAAYPDSLKLGGNVNGVNSYAGVSLSDLTGGVATAEDLFDPTNPKAACFFAQFATTLIPDAATSLLSDLTAVTGLVNDLIKPVAGGLDCPIVGNFDQTLFDRFPGRQYNPLGQATNF